VLHRAGFEVRHVEGLREHYPLTLRAWQAISGGRGSGKLLDRPQSAGYRPAVPVEFLTRTYVILVLPKCLLTWGYVEVDAATFCLQHDDRHGESAGPVVI